MSNPIGNAGEVEDLAARLRSDAAELQQLHQQAMNELNSVEWRGRRADRARAAAREGSVEVDRQAAELNRLSSVLNAHADWIRATQRELRNLEDRIRRWAASHPPDPNRPGPDSSLVGRFPGDCDPEWRQLARRLEGHGARF